MIHNEDLQKQSKKILGLIESAEKAFDEDDEMRSHIAKYVCVLCSGFLENCVHILYTDFVKTETESVSVIAYASTMLNKIQNPHSDKFKEIAKSFKPEWELPLKEYLQEEERGAAINYIMRDRHKIAHGKDSDITLSRIKEYHLKTVAVIQFIENQCGLVEIVDDATVAEVYKYGTKPEAVGGEEAVPIAGIEPAP